MCLLMLEKDRAVLWNGVRLCESVYLINQLMIVKLIIVSVDVTENTVQCGTVSICVTMSGLITASTDGDIEFISNSFSHLFLGYTCNDLVGKVHFTYLTFVDNLIQPEIISFLISSKCAYHHHRMSLVSILANRNILTSLTTVRRFS